MQNKVQNGKTIEYSPTSTAVSAGQMVLIGTLAAVAVTDIAVGDIGACETEGVFELPKASGAITQGAQLYWDADGDPAGGEAGSGCLVTSATDNLYAGIAWASAQAGDALIPLKLNA